MIWLQKQDIIRHIRNEMITKKKQEIETMQVCQWWSKNAAAYAVFKALFHNSKTKC